MDYLATLCCNIQHLIYVNQVYNSRGFIFNNEEAHSVLNFIQHYPKIERLKLCHHVTINKHFAEFLAMSYQYLKWIQIDKCGSSEYTLKQLGKIIKNNTDLYHLSFTTHLHVSLTYDRGFSSGNKMSLSWLTVVSENSMYDFMALLNLTIDIIDFTFQE
jgi:hypothetical protein